MSVETLSPSVIPAKGRITLSGVITNTSDQVWRDINIYPLTGTTPLTTHAELAEAMALEPNQPIGERLLSVSDRITELRPGDSAAYAVRVPRSALAENIPLNAPAGVYWIGVHALGADDSGRDPQFVADGRARTFIAKMPKKPRDRTEALPLAVVLPLRHGVRRTPEGAIANAGNWATDLAAVGGRLRATVDFGAAAGARRITWLVDPAVPAAVRQLTRGNPGLPLGTNLPPDGVEAPDVSESPAPTDSGSPAPPVGTDVPTTPSDAESSAQGSSATPEASPTAEPSAEEAEAALEGASWLARAETALTGRQLLLLPYGDLDVAAAARHSPDWITTAQARTGETLPPWRLPGVPATASPSGNVWAPGLSELADTTLSLASDAFVDAGDASGPVPTTRDVDGRRVVFTSSLAVGGGPGPDDPMGAVAMRQQILADGALRQLSDEREPLVVALPNGWVPADPQAFWSGLDVDFLRLDDLSVLTATTPPALDADDIAYSAFQERYELDADVFDAADQLTQVATGVDAALVRNDRLAAATIGNSLNSLSLQSRRRPVAARGELGAQRRYLAAALNGVGASGPSGLTLSSERGRLQALVVNSLDQPVSVVLTARAERGLSVDADVPVTLGPGEQLVVNLDVTADRLGLYDVTLLLLDPTGREIGTRDVVPVRVAQVSAVIWIVIVAGAGLLIGAIALRLIRRLRARRAEEDADVQPAEQSGPA